MADRVHIEDDLNGGATGEPAPEIDRGGESVCESLSLAVESSSRPVESGPRAASNTVRVENWIQSPHLRLEALESYRREFWSRPLRILVLKDFLDIAAASELSLFLEHEAEFNRRYGLYSTAHRYQSVSEVSEKEWLDSEEPDRFYSYGDYAGAAAQYEQSPNFLRFQKFFLFLRGGEFRSAMEAITGLDLGPPLINAYRYQAGDFLKLHDDDARDKHLSFIFYLSPDWDPRFGGLLHMTGSEGGIQRIPPDFNSMVVFDVTSDSEHYISVVEPEAGKRARLSISGWFRKSSTQN